MPVAAAVRSPYLPSFYAETRAGASRSAEAIVPLVLSCNRVHSVVDVGCGTGAWLASFRANGVRDVLGIDGDWVQAAQLCIPQEQFVRRDLTRPLAVERRFDLAMCLEVAEHLPATRAAGLVCDLTRLAPCVLFSAAVPGQGGTNHVNEQPLSYWSEHFARHGFAPSDLIRPLIWADERVEWWYRQNIVFFAAHEHPILAHQARSCFANDYFHPDFVHSLRRELTPPEMTLGRMARVFPGLLQRSFRTRLGRLVGR
jgi:SAM-dependent methyltransferase